MESGGPVQDQPNGAVALQAGTRLGNYEIGARLGEGSMGAVYEGIRTDDGKAVAIKVLNPELGKQPLARARFLEEGKLTTRVRHPNIVEVIEAGEDGDRAFLVMELLDGEDLARRLRAGAMAISEAADLLLPICDAVAAAHERGITHRDLKPSNIFLAGQDGRTRPIVLDFGIAKEEGGAPTKANEKGGDKGGDKGGRKTGGTPAPAPRMVLGTPYYLAPEQVADHRAAGPASDQYALGVILYECLTGERPYGGDDMAQLFRVIVGGDAPPPRTRRGEIPAELEAVVLRAMSPKPGERFASVADFRKALLPFASSPAARARAGRRRPPSSPAIEVEAATPSPFVRTLTPETQTDNGPWFGAPWSPEDSSEEITMPAPSPIGAADARGLKSSPHLAEVEGAWIHPSPKPARARLLAVGAAAAVAIVSLILVLASGGSPSRPVPPPVSTVQTLPDPSPTAPSPQPSPPAEIPQVAKSAPSPPSPGPAAVPPSEPSPPAPAVAAREATPPARVGTVRPARVPAPPVARPEAAVAPVAAAKPSPSPAATASTVARKPVPVAPRPVNVATAAVRQERPVAPTAVDGGPRERPVPPHPRDTAPPEVKTHNGVPLLD